jgi:hypothetical protein
VPPSERRKKITIQAGQICPLCREKVHREEVLAVCPGCRAVYHKDCSGELARGRCTTLGCRYSQRRTASGRRPTAPVRDERQPRAPRPPLTPSEQILRGAMACGVTIGFLFLAVHVSKSIEANTAQQRRAKRHARQARELRAVLAGYRTKSVKLRELSGRFPPGTWRFPQGKFHFAGSSPNAALLTWEQLRDVNAPSPLDPYFPRGFRAGLALSTLSPSSPDFPKPWGLPHQVREASQVRFVIALRVDSLRPAEPIGIRRSGGVRPSWSSTVYSRKAAQEAGIWPTGSPAHAQAEVAVKAYLYDLDAEPSYKGALEIRARSPLDFNCRSVDPLTGMPAFRARSRDISMSPQEELLVDELRRSGLEPGELVRADVAALQEAYRELRRELGISTP